MPINESTKVHDTSCYKLTQTGTSQGLFLSQNIKLNSRVSRQKKRKPVREMSGNVLCVMRACVSPSVPPSLPFLLVNYAHPPDWTQSRVCRETGKRDSFQVVANLMTSIVQLTS